MDRTQAERIAEIRRRPGMYIGNTGPGGILVLAMEVVSNSFDMVLGGQATRIDVAVSADGTITVADDGPGIGAADPTAETLRSFYTRVHDSPTADGHWPHVHLSSGTGLAPVCALTSELHVEARHTDATLRQSFARAVELGGVERLPPDATTGTTTRLTPDQEVFGDAVISLPVLAERLSELAHLRPGLVLTLEEPDGSVRRFGPHDGLVDLFHARFADERSATTPDPPIVLATELDDLAVDLVMAWSDFRYRVDIAAWGNYRHILEPGWEVDGIEEGLRDVFGSGPVRDPIRGLMAGLRAVLHVQLLDPKFPGPTGRRLASPEATWVVADLIAEQLPGQLDRHPDLAASLRARSHTRAHHAIDEHIR